MSVFQYVQRVKRITFLFFWGGEENNFSISDTENSDEEAE